MADNSTEAILAAIGALDEKFDRKFDELKKVDKDLTDEVQRLGREVESVKGEVRDLRSETLRTFESERHASAQTFQAITRHVDDSAKAFQEKAADIDEVKAETKRQTEELAKQTAILTRLDAIAANPTVRRAAYAVGSLIIAYAAAKGLVLK